MFSKQIYVLVPHNGKQTETFAKIQAQSLLGFSYHSDAKPPRL
jgi:hypothetical protein